MCIKQIFIILSAKNNKADCVPTFDKTFMPDNHYHALDNQYIKSQFSGIAIIHSVSP